MEGSPIFAEITYYTNNFKTNEGAGVTKDKTCRKQAEIVAKEVFT